nr:unnamed protein product [Callosobruchus chinensis]
MTIILCITSFTKTMVENQFLGYIYLIKKRFQGLNKILSNLTETTLLPQVINVRPKNDVLSSLRKLRFLHYDLCEVTKDINSCFSWSLLASISLNFLTFTIYGFSCAMRIYKRLFGGRDYQDEESLAVSCIWISLQLCDFTAMAVVCSQVTAEVKNTTTILFNFKELVRPLVFIEIKIFLNQIIQWDLKITAANFFDIDMRLIYNVSYSYMVLVLYHLFICLIPLTSQGCQ